MLFLRIFSPACFHNQIFNKYVRLTTKTLSIILLAAFMTSCGTDGDKKVSSNEGNSSAQFVKASNAPTADGNLSFTEKDIAALKSKFEFEDKWFHHKHWGKKFLKRRTLTADVNESGYFTLNSNFFAPKKGNHVGIQVTVGGKEILSDKIDIKSNEHRTEKGAKGVFELNTYTSYGDKGIFEQIGKSKDETVLVRFLLKNGSYVEEELSKADQKALQECFQLSLVLRQIQKMEKE